MAELPPIVMNAETERFELTLEGHTAFAEYHLEPGVLVLPHTVTPPDLGGRGVGSALAEAALGYARANHLKVKPFCPFIAGYIMKHPEWQDLVHDDLRQKLGL